MSLLNLNLHVSDGHFAGARVSLLAAIQPIQQTTIHQEMKK